MSLDSIIDVVKNLEYYFYIIGGSFVTYQALKGYRTIVRTPLFMAEDESGLIGELVKLHRNAHLMDEGGNLYRLEGDNERSRTLKYLKLLAKVPGYVKREIKGLISGNYPNFVRVYAQANDRLIQGRIEFVQDETTIRRRFSLPIDKSSALPNDIFKLRLKDYPIGQI